MKNIFLIFSSLIFAGVLLSGCAGIIPGGGGNYNSQPGTVGIENPSPAIAHLMLFEASGSCCYGDSAITTTKPGENHLLAWRKEGNRLVLSFRRQPIRFDADGYMKGLNGHIPANIWKVAIPPEVIKWSNVQILHLVPDRYYTLVAYFTYPVSGNLIPVRNQMFWTRNFYVPAELRAYRDRFGTNWFSAFVRLPRVSTQVLSGRLCPEIEIDLP